MPLARTLGALTLSLLPPLAIGCDHCDTVTECETFGVTTWCLESQKCLVNGTTPVCGGSGTTPSCELWYFSISDTPQILTVPVSELPEEADALDVLLLHASAGSPMDATEIEIRFDGTVASCEVEFAERDRRFRCQFPAASSTLEVVSARTDVAFHLWVDLSEEVCTQTARYCPA